MTVRKGIVGTVAVSIATAFALAGYVCAQSPDASAAEGASSGVDSLKVLLKEGKLAEAESGAVALLERYEGTGAPDSSIARVIDVLTESRWRRGITGGPEGRQLAERAVALKKKAFGDGHPEVANSLQQLAVLSAVAGDPAAARPLFEAALAIFEERLGPDHERVAACLTGLANVLGDLGDAPAAISAYERVLKIRERVNGPESAEVAVVLNNIAATNYDRRDYVAARRAAERAVAILEKVSGPDDPMLALFLNGLATTLYAMGEYATAQSMAERAVAIWEKAYGPENPYVAMGLNTLASVLYTRGDYASIRPIFERALAINEKAFGPDHPYVARVLNSLGVTDLTAGDPAGARPFLERALAIREKVFGAEHVDVARSQMNLGNALVDLGEGEKARTLFEQALATDEKVLGPENPDVALILEHLGSSLASTGDDSGARRMFERCLAIREKALGAEHSLVASCLDRLADLDVASGDLSSALSHATRSLTTREKTLGPDHPDVGESLGRLARVEALQGDVDHALKHALAGERVARDHLRLTSRALSERQALRYATVHTSGRDITLSLAARGLDADSRRRALDALVRSRAIVLDEMAARHRAASGADDPQIARLADALATARARLANISVRGVGEDDPETYRKLFEDTRAEREKAERALAEASEGFARESTRGRLGLDDVAATLTSRSALVAFAEYRRSDLAPRAATATAEHHPKSGEVPSYLAFVLRSGEADPEVVDVGTAEAIDGLVAGWTKEVSTGALRTDIPSAQSERQYRESGAALRKAVWDPLVFALDGVDRVFIVPDGSLNLVNIVALPADDGSYLIERGPLVHYLSAERDLVPATDERRGEGLLAVGAPDFDATSLFASLAKEEPRTAPKAAREGATPILLASAAVYRGHHSDCGEFASARFERLPATGKEVHEVVELWKEYGKGDVAPLDLTAAAASETALKRRAGGRRVLHLATHGFFLGRGCEPSPASARGIGSLTETQIAKPAGNSPLMVGENPLLRSGLALAGANHRSAAGENEDDGILTAEEIASLDLSGVSCAVLSACETGVGDIRAGEGVFGLRRAFQVAGVGTLIMSLWSVDDAATRSWMKAFYEGSLRDRLDTAEAVRRASLEVLEERRARRQSTHPFFWAAFVAAGDWR